jgi:glycerate kinase
VRFSNEELAVSISTVRSCILYQDELVLGHPVRKSMRTPGMCGVGEWGSGELVSKVSSANTKSMQIKIGSHTNDGGYFVGIV